ncbi:uncharacterized protein LOC127751493 [Frankliniella occidentalis]|uniref:Uncharacterized protein LOC127751493 n=1 Tax=Frankliniella occidentalis TaxID=133901 RepID=A0A9C6X8H1_FRAOC|nr:uncharacterized protein LOC127751493 [Frankliniella occidentalis]
MGEMDGNGGNGRKLTDGLEINGLTASNGLRVSAAQLRALWCHDNECGRKYMKGCPLRTCSALDGLSCGEAEGEGQGLTSQEFELLKIRIGEMWRIASTLFEVFIQKGAELEGYRVRVRTDKPLNVSIKPLEAIEFGWIAQIPKELALAHVFNRSALEPNGYFGGPVSYMNWCETKKQKVAVITCESHSMCRIYLSGSHGPGKELKWDYGRTEMPILHDWFLPECCQLSTVDPVEKKRHEKYSSSRRIHWFTESCVLCGELFSIANKEFRVQRKQHFIGKHANFLGSLWDGCGSYDLEKVSRDTLLYMAEKLNHFLNELKTMNWGLLPACKVFNEE